jgi:DNA polymerase III gamma/tau subunit
MNSSVLFLVTLLLIIIINKLITVCSWVVESMAACNALMIAEEQAEREQEWQQEQEKEKEWQQEQQTEKNEWQQKQQTENEWQQEQQTEKEWQQEQQKEKEWQQEQQKEKGWQQEQQKEKEWQQEKEQEWQQEQQTEKEWQQEQQTEKEWQQEQQKEKEWQKEQQTEKEGGEAVSKRKPPPVRSPVVCGLGLQLEMAEMAELLYNRVGRFCFSLCICLYLYGDLAIYCTAVAKSIRDITCTPSEVGMQILYPLTSSRLVH